MLHNELNQGTDIPYISHLLGVASLVLEHGGDDEQAMAALLHDAVEDQGAHQLEVIAIVSARAWPTSSKVAPMPTRCRSAMAGP